jgi:hypothetical protein
MRGKKEMPCPKGAKSQEHGGVRANYLVYRRVGRWILRRGFGVVSGVAWVTSQWRPVRRNE